MRAVVDTNVVVSAAINPNGTPAQVILAWELGAFTWITSEPLLQELARTVTAGRVRRYLVWNQALIEDFILRVRGSAEIVSPTREIQRIATDPADNRVLEAAVEGDSDYIVSGDRHLLGLKHHESTRIVTPVQFLAILTTEATNP